MVTFEDIYLANYQHSADEDSAADVIAHITGVDAVTSYRISRNLNSLQKAHKMFNEERDKLIQELGCTEDEDGNEVPAFIPADDVETVAAFNDRMAELMAVEVLDVKWYPVKLSKVANADIPPYVFNRLAWLFEDDTEA